MSRDSVSRESSAPQRDFFPFRSFWRTYPLVAAGHLFALLLFILIAKFVARRPPAPTFFSPVSVGSMEAASEASARSHPAPEKPVPSLTTRAESTTKAVVPAGKVPAVGKPAAPVSKKAAVPPRKPSIRPNLQEVTRTLPSDEPSGPAGLRHAQSSATPVSARTSASGKGEEAPTSSPEPSSSGPAWYYSLIRDRLYAAWDQPLHLSQQNLVAKVQIFVAKDGRISKPVLLSPSANEEFDRSVLAAAHRVDAVGEPRPSEVPEIVTVTFRMVR